jgi:hypothetical protein
MGSIIDVFGKSTAQTMNLWVEIATGKMRGGMPELGRFA